MFDAANRVQFINTNSTVDAGTVYVEVLRTALTPELGKRVASELNIMVDLCATTHVTYTIVNKANDRSLFAPTDQCLSGFHMLRSNGVVIESYDKDADTKIRQVLNCHMDADPPQSTLLVLVSGDRDFSDVISRAQREQFDMVIIHSKDAEVNPTLKTLVRSPDRVMNVWNSIEKKARDAAADPVSPQVGAAVGTPDRTPSSRPDPAVAQADVSGAQRVQVDAVPVTLVNEHPKIEFGAVVGDQQRLFPAPGGKKAASRTSKRLAGPEEAVVPVAAQHYLKMAGTKDIYGALSTLHCRLVNTPMSVARPSDGGHADMYMGATFEGDGPVTDAPASHRIKATIEDYLKSIREESVEIQGMSMSTFVDDKATLIMAKKAGVALYLDQEPLQPNALFIEGPTALLGSKVLVSDYCQKVVRVPVRETHHHPVDQEGLADGFVRLRITLNHSAGNELPKLKSVCLAHAKDNVKFSDSVVASGSGGQVAAPKLDPINENWVFAVVDKRIGGKDHKSIMLFCRGKSIPMFRVDIKDQDQELAPAGYCIARCNPNSAGPGDPASSKAAVEKCLKVRVKGIWFFKDAMRVPTKVPQITTDDVSVKVNLAFHERNTDDAERVKKHLISKARTSATIPIQPGLMAITRAALPILKAEVLSCGIKGDDFYLYREAPEAASGQIIIKGSLDAVYQAKAVLGKRLGLSPAAKSAVGSREVGVMVRSVVVPRELEANQNLTMGVSHVLNVFFSQFAIDDDDDAKEEYEEEQALEAPIVWTVDRKQKVKISITSLVPEDAQVAGEQKERVDRAVAVADKYIREFQETFLQQSDFRGFSNFADKKLHLNVRKTFDVFVVYCSIYSCGNSASQGGPQPAGDPFTVMVVVETTKFSHYSQIKDFCSTHLNIDVWSVQYRQEDQPTSSGFAIYSINLNRKSGSPGAVINQLLAFKKPGTGIVGFFRTLTQCNSHLEAQSGGDGTLVVFGPKEAVDEAVEFIKEAAKGCAPSSHVLCAEDKRVAWVLFNRVNKTKRNTFIESVKNACQAKGVSQVNLSAASASGFRGELMTFVGLANSVTSAIVVANSEVEKLVGSMKSTEVKLSQHEFAFLITENNDMKKRLEDAHGVIISVRPTTDTSKKSVQKILATAQLGSVAIEVREGDLLASGSEAIVNPANGRLAHAAGAAAAIRMAAGGDEFDQLCSSALDALVRARSPKVGGDGELLLGVALTTGPCRLSAKGMKVVVHAVGPVHRTGSQSEENSFLSAVKAAFEEAVNAGCKSVSLPLMGAGVYGWRPKDSASIMLLGLSQAVAQYGNSSPITHIVLVDLVPAHATAFKEALSSYVAGSSGPGTGDVPTPQVVVPLVPEFKWYWENFGKWEEYDYDQVMQIERAIRDGSLPVTITGDVAGQFSDSKHKPPGALTPVYAVSKEPTKAQDGKTYDFRQVNVASLFPRAVKREPFKAGDAMYGYTPQTSAGNLRTCTSSLMSRYSDVFLLGCACTFYVLVTTPTMPKSSHSYDVK